MKSRVFLPAVLSGLLLWAAFFPLDLGPVAFVALVPFLTLVRAEGVGAKRRYLAAFLGGLTFSVLAIKWIRVAHPAMMLFAWPGLSLVCALYWPLALYLLRKLDRLNLPFAVTLPVVWVSLEFARAHFPTGFEFMTVLHLHQLIGFGWYFLGYTQHHVLPLVQAADLGGVYVVSAAVAAVNGAAYEWAVRSALVRRLLRRPAAAARVGVFREAWVTAGAAAVTLGLAAYGLTRMTHPPFPAGPRVAAVQGNLPQNEKMMRGDPQDDPAGPRKPTPLEKEYFEQADLAARSDGRSPKPDLVVWPETCFPGEWLEVAADPETRAAVPAVELEYAEQFPKWLGEYTKTRLGTNSLYGLNAVVWRDGRPFKYNSALLVRNDGTAAGRYDKIHLVPFGEYVPLRDQFPWLQMFTPYKNDYSCTPGENWTRFELPTAKGRYRFAVLICYEDSDPYLARRYNPASETGEGVDFLVNISNDGWFDGTEEHEQHLAICRFRAVEARRSVVRAVNMGISAVIDPDGRVVALPVADDWAKSKKTRGVVRAEVPLDTRATVYAAAGDWFAGLCWAGLAVGLLAAGRRAGTAPPLPPGAAGG